jgi:hypothetical protein
MSSLYQKRICLANENLEAAKGWDVGGRFYKLFFDQILRKLRFFLPVIMKN